MHYVKPTMADLAPKTPVQEAIIAMNRNIRAKKKEAVMKPGILSRLKQALKEGNFEECSKVIAECREKRNQYSPETLRKVMVIGAKHAEQIGVYV